ncbi:MULTISPECIES: hypothetical protein [Paraburkholderia]|uniref:hypothetical protein n=1 Tax=Paraburkholderia TaxID=1822464 RepID=UPI00225290C4|nr:MULTISPECIES: hypothetical protein [Paraburkholderia]MCX4159652.1 hypothetical protein [Paraburkholderia aspalathi]MDN7169050.1 hypothetical protein [Paraburkholderia sp. SECH2]MDQ6397537.1 hypothetical protein [Paraburkholderia aspalathi]
MTPASSAPANVPFQSPAAIRGVASHAVMHGHYRCVFCYDDATGSGRVEENLASVSNDGLLIGSGFELLLHRVVFTRLPGMNLIAKIRCRTQQGAKIVDGCARVLEMFPTRFDNIGQKFAVFATLAHKFENQKFTKSQSCEAAKIAR